MRAVVISGGALVAAVKNELEPHGFEVIGVDSLDGAAAALAAGGCALVVMDCDRGDAEAAGGFGALAAASARNRAALVACSREYDPLRVAQLLAAGADDVLRLPEEGSRLLSRALAARVRASEPPAIALPYREIFERNPLIMAIVDEETLRFLSVSDGAVRQYGWSREEFLQRSLYDVRPAECFGDLDHAVAAPGPSLLTTTHHRKDGSRFTSRGLLQKVAAEGRRLCFAVSRDVTEEVRAAQAHQRAVADFEAVVERTADGVFIHRHDLALVYANPAFVRFLGYPSASALIGRGALELVHPEDREVVRGRIQGILSSGQSSVARPIRFLGADGQVRWAETRGIDVLYGNERVVTVLARDLTERRKADEALRLSEERFSRIFHASPACISLTRLSDRRFVDVNERFVEVTGFSHEEVVGRSAETLRLWRDPAEWRALYEMLQRDGRLRDVEVALWTKRGEALQVAMSAELVDLAGEACALVLATDLSAFKRVEAQLQHAHKMEAIGRFAGGIAHDFNNVLTGIRGYSDVLIQQLPVESKARAAAEHIQRASLRAASLANRLLLFTRRQPVETRVMALNEVVGQMAALLRRIIGDDVTLELDLRAAADRVRIDPAQVEQIILNLAVNARDAMPAGGRLRIATHDEIDGGGGSARVVLEVADNGMGMTEEVRARIFEPYFTTKDVGKGTGLGLSIVYGIVEQTGGTIRCESAPGHGTVFSIGLAPVDEPVEPLRKPLALASTPPPGTETVLVVEDDDEVRDFVQFVLGRAGYEVLVAVDGCAALALAAGEGSRVRLLVSDLVMPRMNGTELAARWREIHPRTRVLHMSGYPGGKAAPTGPEESNFLQKPFAPDELLRRVRALLDAAPP